MESTPLHKTDDPENSFHIKKLKAKRPGLESLSAEVLRSLDSGRHIAREALRREEAETENDLPHIANRVLDRRRRAPEAKQLHGGPEAPGHIGHVLVTAEAASRAREAQKTAGTHERLQLGPNKRIDTLPRSELLSLSEQIAVEGSTLRQIYETHLIGEQALRRLIAEYLQTGHIEQALRREIVEHEIDFERDPALRDTSMVSSSDSHETKQLSATGKEALHDLLQKAEAGIAAGSEALTYDTTHPNQALPQRDFPSRQLRRPVDVIMVAVIAVLVILVMTLYFWHH